MTTALLLGGVALSGACSDPDPHRGAGDPDSGTADGSGATGGSSATGGSAGAGATGGAAGATGGTAGATGGSAGSSGSGGTTQPLEAFGMLFSVAPGSLGLTGTGVESELPSPESNAYTSNGSGASELAGTNALGLTAENLGLLPSDDLDALSVLHPSVPIALFFSVLDRQASSEGTPGTAVRRESDALEVQGDIYFSYALANAPGSVGGNQLWTDESRLGLRSTGDDLNALEIDAPSSAHRTYFSVGATAAGAPGTALASTPAAERGCTLYYSDGGGQNTVLWTCAQLGLVPGDDVDALVMIGGATPSHALFSVTRSTVGAAGMAVASEAAAGEAGADVFVSAGQTDNQIFAEDTALGLLPADELDALAIRTGDVAATWLPPPPPPPEPPPTPPPPPPACGVGGGTFHPNANADAPQRNSNPSIGTRVAPPGLRIRQAKHRVATLSGTEAATVSSLIPCGGARRTIPGLPATRAQGFCTQPVDSCVLNPGVVYISVVQTDAKIANEDYAQFQFSDVIETDGNPSNGYQAAPPYDFDYFDGGDFAIHLEQAPNGSTLLKYDNIATSPFTAASVPACALLLDDLYFVIANLPPGAVSPELITARSALFGSDGNYGQTGGPWDACIMNPVDSPFISVDDDRCP